MRIAVLGTVAAAFVGGTLAVTPLTTVSAPLPVGGMCDATGGAGCEKLAAVLMPEAPKPVAQHAESPAFSEAGNMIAPQPAPEPGAPSAASEVPAAAAPAMIGGGSAGPAIGGSGTPVGGLGGVPDGGLGGIPDPYALAPMLPGLAGAVPGLAGVGGLTAIPVSAASVLPLLLGSASSVFGLGESAVFALIYLKDVGLLPNNIGLPSFSIPGVNTIGTSGLTTAAAALPAVASIPGAAAVLPAAGLPSVGVPAIPALPALPALPAVGLPAAPALAGLPALPHPQFCTPSIGPIGACTP